MSHDTRVGRQLSIREVPREYSLPESLKEDWGITGRGGGSHYIRQIALAMPSYPHARLKQLRVPSEDFDEVGCASP